jgi:hypothetical protein
MLECRGVAQDQSTLAELVENEPGKHEAEPSEAERDLSEAENTARLSCFKTLSHDSI